MAASAAVMSETRSTKGAATRDQILNAAARLIHLQGYQCTSLDDVLRESGVGKGNFYYYFKSKEDLGYAIIDRITQASSSAPSSRPSRMPRRTRSRRSTRSSIGCSRPSASATASGAARWVIWPRSSPTCTRGSGSGSPGIFDLWRAHLAEVVSRGQARGRLRADMDASRVAQFLVAGLEGSILLSKVTKDITVMERCVEELKQHLTLYGT